jgi:diguanylate cyclase (GGDEF)-like protein
MLTIHTLHVECVMLMLIYTVLAVANSVLYRGVKGIHWFTLYNFFSLLSAVAVALRGNIPDFVSIVAGNLFFVVAYVLLWISLAALFGDTHRGRWIQITLLAVATITMLQWGLIHPDTTRRLIAYSIVLLLQETHIVLFILRKENGARRQVGGPLAVMVGALALTNLVRVLGVAQLGAPSNYLQAGPFLSWIVMINSCLQCGAVVAYVWMTAAMLRTDLEAQASTDPLTGLLNRRAIERAADRQMAACVAGQTPLSAIIVDLDRFKSINDECGHHRGDETLMAVANALSAGIRQGDLLARMGGDEFAILLPSTGIEGAHRLSEKLRASIAGLHIGEVHPTGITASFGLAQADLKIRDWDHLIIQCDKALYAAKNEGGNVTSTPAPERTFSPATAT